MMRRIKNGEPVFHFHKCFPDRIGEVMTAEELHEFAVEVLMSEYGDTNSEVIKYDKQFPNEADFCFVNTGKQPSFTGDNSKGKTVNVLVVYKDRLDADISDIDTTWMVEEYQRTGNIPRITIATSWCVSDYSENGKPAVCGGEFCFAYHSISLIPGEENEPLERYLSAIELAAKYVEAWENFDASIVAPYLDKDYHYGSDWVFDEMPSRYEYLSYFQGKLNAVKRGGAQIKFYVGRDHQTGDVAVILLQKGEYSALKIKTRDGRIVSGCMKEYDERYKIFDPADELYQHHGDHLDCIMPAEELMSNHIQKVLSDSKVWRLNRTEVTTDEMYEQKTEVYSLMYGEGDVRMLSLIAVSKANNENQFMSTYPIAKGKPFEIKIDKVIEWDNQIEATVLCSIDGFEFAFFPIDYYCNKKKYKVGRTISVELSALAMKAQEGQRGFQFEGQQAIDWLAKIGQEPTYDEQGNVEPVKFNMENLVAFIDKNSKCPNEAEFQSPGTGLDVYSLLDVELYKTNIMICRREIDDKELELSIPLYFRKEFFPEFMDGDPLRGWIWIIGNITGKHEQEEKKDNSISSLSEFCADFAKFMEECNFESFMNLMHILRKLPLLKIREGYELDAFQRGDNYGDILQAYCCKAGASKHYVPTQVKNVEETVKSNTLFGLFSKTENKNESKKIHIPYDDSLRIHGKIGWGEGEDIPEALTYFDVPFTEEGIMQAWFLDNLTDFMPKGWHCNYSCKDFLFDHDNFEQKIEKTLSKDPKVLKEFLKIDLESLLPKVLISGETATLEYAYWNDWSGMVKAKTTVTREGNTVKFSKPETIVLIKYDCGIMF